MWERLDQGGHSGGKAEDTTLTAQAVTRQPADDHCTHLHEREHGGGGHKAEHKPSKSVLLEEVQPKQSSSHGNDSHCQHGGEEYLQEGEVSGRERGEGGEGVSEGR